MTVNGRQKGAQAEREIIKAMQTVVNSVLGGSAFVLKRNLEQCRNGGADISGAAEEYDVISVEIKRQERLLINTFWEQTQRQANESGRTPVLVYKQNRQPWRVRMPVNLYGMHKTVIGEISFDDFLGWYRRVLIKIKYRKVTITIKH